jgi:aspartokinase-like uncharacterized kinase
MSGLGFFPTGGVSSADVFRLISSLNELGQTLSKIAAVKGGEEYTKGLTSLDVCAKNIKTVMDVVSALKADSPDELMANGPDNSFRF